MRKGNFRFQISDFRFGLALAAVVLLAGCATPRLESMTMTWAPGTSLPATLARTTEEGYQLYFGARHQATAGPGALASQDVDKSSTAATILGLAGIAAGAYTSGPIGAVAGGVGGAAVGHYLDGGNAPTTSTAALLAKTSLAGPGAAGPLSSAGGSQATVVTPGGALGGVLGSGAISPSVATFLKDYIKRNPSACKLVPLLGQDGVDQLIDQVTGRDGADLSAIIGELLARRTGVNKP